MLSKNLFDKHAASIGIAGWVAMSNLLRVLRQKEILTNEDIDQVLQGALADLEGNDRAFAREAKEILQEELRSMTGFPAAPQIGSHTMTETLTFRFVSPDGDEHTLMRVSRDAVAIHLIEADPAGSREEDRRRRGTIAVTAKPGQVQESSETAGHVMRVHLGKLMKWHVEGANVEGMFRVISEGGSKFLRLTLEEG
jgi:hypothetical protein